jgi:hypothetical protein
MPASHDQEPSPETELRQLAHAVRGLTISRSDPERFFVDRSEIASALVQLSRQLHRLGVPVPAPTPPPRVAAPVTPAPKPRIVLVRGYPGRCERCRRPFEGVQPTKRFCSHPCRQAVYRERLRACAQAPEAAPASRLAGAATGALGAPAAPVSPGGR